LEHPFPSPNLTGFDVRGIAMFNATGIFPTAGLSWSDRDLGDGAVVAPDGYTTLYNSTTLGSGPAGLEGYMKGKFATKTAPNGLLNPFMRFISDDPSNTRNAFLAGDTLTVTYEVDMPSSGFVFGYAIDANWAPPLHKPVTDPMNDFGPGANCPEPWKIDASSSHIGPWGGGANVTIDVYDRQGSASHKAPVLECPDLFDGEITATFEIGLSGFARYAATINNDKLAPNGTYKCLVSAEDNSNDPVGKPWLDLTAYQIIDVVVSPEFNLTEVTPPWLNGATLEYDVDGNYLYMSASFNGIQVFDISDPANPLWVRNIYTGPDDYVSDLVIWDGYIYAAVYGADLVVIDIDPLQDAHVVKEVSTTGAPFAIDNNGATLYVATETYPDGFVDIFDITDPTEPVIINSVPYAGFPYEIRYSNGYAYLAAQSGGLAVLDVDPPESASVVATITSAGAYTGVWVDGPYAYATSGMSLQIVDIDPPETALIVKSVDMPTQARDVTTYGGYAYVADTDMGAQIVDIDPPGSAAIVGSFTCHFWPTECLADGNTLFVGAEGGTMVLDLTNPVSPVTLKVLDYPGSLHGLDTAGDRMIGANMDGGTIIVDAASPSSAVVSNVVPSGMTYIVTVDGNYAYELTSGYLTIIDITTPGAETLVQSIPHSGSCEGLVASGGYAYAAGGDDGLVIYDVDPPASASLVSSTPLSGGYVSSVGMTGGYAYLGTYDAVKNDVAVVDVADPASPVEKLTVPLTFEAHDFAFSGNYAFVANEDAGLTVIDISDPLSASVVGSTDLSGSAAESIELLNDYAFVLDYSDGLVVVDISNPLAPSEVANLNVDGYKYELAMTDNYAYIACIASGLHIVSLW